MERYFFAGGNTPNGFFSYFNNVIDYKRNGRLVILKGGPGVGKSTFIRAVGEKLKSKGKNAEYFYCSGDPESLDGVCCKEDNFAVIDGTSPHMIDPVYPGITDSIVNLGEFLDGNKLVNYLERAKKLLKDKAYCFENAYKYLNAAGALEKIEYDTYQNNMNFKALEDKCREFTENFYNLNKKGGHRRLFLSAVTPDGMIDKTPETFLKDGENQKNHAQLLKISCYSNAELNFFLTRLNFTLNNLGYDTECFYNPMRPLEIMSLYIVNNDMFLFGEFSEEQIYENKNYKVINLTGCVSRKDFQNFLNSFSQNKKLTLNLIGLAAKQMDKARGLHKKVEEFYFDAMNFNGLERFRNEFIEKL